MKRKQSLYLNDITNAIEAILKFVDGMTSDEFKSDDRTFSAVIRKLEIIGEASKSISSEVAMTHPEIPWSVLARMRDKLIHGYFGIDADVIWKTVKEDLPVILPFVKKLENNLQD